MAQMSVVSLCQPSGAMTLMKASASRREYGIGTATVHCWTSGS
jgi:hypothetical protein